MERLYGVKRDTDNEYVEPGNISPDLEVAQEEKKSKITPVPTVFLWTHYLLVVG